MGPRHVTRRSLPSTGRLPVQTAAPHPGNTIRLAVVSMAYMQLQDIKFLKQLLSCLAAFSISY